MSKRKTFEALVAVISVLGLLAGCGQAASADSRGSETGVKTVTVATAGMPKPFTYVGDDGQLTGYDVEVLKKVDEDLPQYRFKFEKVEFSALLTGLDAGRYQIGANSLSATAERRQKYLISAPYFQDYFGLVVADDTNDITGLESLGGRTTITSPGIATSAVLENLNKNELKDNPIKINYANTDLATQYTSVSDHKDDFLIDIKSNYDAYRKELGVTPRFVSLPKEESLKLGDPNRVFLFSKADGDALQKDVDASLKKLTGDGILKELSEKYFDGGDYSPQE